MTNQVTYQRPAPCIHCGSHLFYINNRNCKPCSNKRSKELRLKNADAQRESLNAWRKKNKDYVSAYRKARYQMKRDAMPYIFAIYMMTRGEA